MLSEFDIIRTCFDQPGLAATCNNIVKQSIGDDCAVIAVPAGKELAFSMDTLVADIHFPSAADPAAIARRALAVNLSDLAATGATPLVFTLALTLPESDATWLQNFALGLREIAEQYECYLIGGDTTRGPLTITLQVQGLVDAGNAITRNGAAQGDRIYVTGNLGGAAHYVNVLKSNTGPGGEDLAVLETAFYRPTPRLALGAAAAGIVSAGIDISDGLLADLGHICSCSNSGAELNLTSVPVHPVLANTLPEKEALALALTGGDDYELLLTAPPDKEETLLALGRQYNVSVHCIGEMTSGSSIRCLDQSGNEMSFEHAGYRHFS